MGTPPICEEVRGWDTREQEPSWLDCPDQLIKVPGRLVSSCRRSSVLGANAQEKQAHQGQDQALQELCEVLQEPRHQQVHRRGLGECLVNKVQVYRQKVTHLKLDEGSGAKEEEEQWRECTAEFPARIVAAAALPR